VAGNLDITVVNDNSEPIEFMLGSVNVPLISVSWFEAAFTSFQKKEVIGTAPLNGTTHVIDIDISVALTTLITGGSGGPRGYTMPLSASTDVPTALLADTLNRYPVPFWRDMKVSVYGPDPVKGIVFVWVDGSVVTVKRVRGIPPVSVGGRNVTVALLFAPVALTMIGGSGGPAGMNGRDISNWDGPTALKAVRNAV
jgi:hypothetical protein